MWNISLNPICHMTYFNLFHSPEKNKSLHLTIAFNIHVLHVPSLSTKHNHKTSKFLFVFARSLDWKMLRNFVYHAGCYNMELPFSHWDVC